MGTDKNTLSMRNIKQIFAGSMVHSLVANPRRTEKADSSTNATTLRRNVCTPREQVPVDAPHISAFDAACISAFERGMHIHSRKCALAAPRASCSAEVGTGNKWEQVTTHPKWEQGTTRLNWEQGTTRPEWKQLTTLSMRTVSSISTRD